MSHRSIALLVCAVGMMTAASTSRAQTAVKDSLGVNNVVYQGWKMFEVYCTRCHGEDAVGSSFAPAMMCGRPPAKCPQQRARR